MSNTAPPTVELEGPSGVRVTVAAGSTDDRVGQLADALGLDPRRPLRLDGRFVGRHESLLRAGLRHGSRLELAPDTTPETSAGTPFGEDVASPVITVDCEAGPAAGTSISLGPGSHVVGRAPWAAVSIADCSLQPHQALLDVGVDGRVELVQLTGRVPARVAGEPVAGRLAVGEEDVIVLGSSRLRLRHRVEAPAPSAVLTACAGDPWRRTLHRTPKARPVWEPVPIAVPQPTPPPVRPSAIGLAAAAFTVAGSALVAVLLRSPMFILFGAVGGLASLGLALSGRIIAGRDLRRTARRWQRDVADFVAAVDVLRRARWRHHLAVVPAVADAITAVTTARWDLWTRRADDPDAFTVGLGWGPVTWTLRLADAALPSELAGAVAAAERFDDAPVPADVGPGAALAVRGPGARSVVRSLVVQLATLTGPADWRLLVLTDEPAGWEWSRWLPHAAPGDGPPMVIAAEDVDLAAAALRRLDDGARRHVVVVVDRPDLLAVRTGAVRRFLDTSPSAAVIVVVPEGEAVPARCRSVLEIGSVGIARWWPDASLPSRSTAVHAAGVTRAIAARAARALAGLHDPEDPTASAGALATTVRLSALSAGHGVGPIDDAIAIAAAWRSAGADPAPAAVLGLTTDGVVEIDLARDGPHGLIAGTTGSGKSELLRALVGSLAARSSPEHLTFVLIDYKGGATFDACADLPHTVGVVTDLDEHLAARALLSLEAELRRRERVLRDAGADDLAVYRSEPSRPPLPRLAVVIDEFAALAAELPAFLSSLVGIAQRGRSLGIHLLLATQRPAGVVDDDIRANTNLRIALRLHDVADARDVIGDPAPAAFPRGTPGRAMLRLGPDETVIFQSALSTGPQQPRRDDRLRVVGDADQCAGGGVSELDVLVDSIRHAAALCEISLPHRPWLAPLPATIEPGEVVDRFGPSVVGIVDDPVGQRRAPLRWFPEDGNLALVGSLGSGTTTALATVLAVLSSVRRPGDLHVYVIDANGDGRLDRLARLPHCGGVVRPHERERLGRLLRRLTDELDARRRSGGRGERPHIVVAIDGTAALRAALDEAPGSAELDLLVRIVGEGTALGVACIVTAERPGGIAPALLAACAERWLFHLDDPAEAVLCGVPAAAAPRTGPGRVVVARSGLEAQLAVVPVPAQDDSAGERGGPRALGLLAADVDATTLPPGSRRISGETELVVGTDFRSLEPARLAVPDGEHVLVAGPPRSGRTTALIRLVESWRQAHPDGVVRAVTPLRRSAVADWPESIAAGEILGAVESVAAGRPFLVAVDDAERLEDHDGALATMVAERRPGLMVIAAGRPDALRTQYGTWTNVVRRSRIGLLMSMCSDTEGDVLGELLPRHPPLRSRPGLAWLVGGGQRALAQVGRSVIGSRRAPVDPAGSPGGL